MLSRSQFLSVYCRLEGIELLDEIKWNALLRVLREKSLTASFYNRLRMKNIHSLIPDYCTNSFTSAVRFADAQAHQTFIQAKKLSSLLSDYDIPFIFLKGAAYTLGGNANGVGRLMTDIDICVVRGNIDTLENVLLNHKWSFKDMDEHDDKYYRAWSHELPPLKNDQEGVVLDVHHTLVPPVKGRFLNINELVSSSVKCDAFNVPSNEWLILHSALHLIINEDVDNGLRDLTDIFTLLTNNKDVKSTITRTYALFVKEGFYYEWRILVLLLNHYFAMEIFEGTETGFPIRYRVRAFALKRAILPRSSYLSQKYSNSWSALNYILGYLSKMPVSILIRQALFKAYRSAVKLVFGEFFFRKARSAKELQ